MQPLCGLKDTSVGNDICCYYTLSWNRRPKAGDIMQCLGAKKEGQEHRALNYLVVGFLTNPVFIKSGQRHVVFIPSFPRVGGGTGGFGSPVAMEMGRRE